MSALYPGSTIFFDSKMRRCRCSVLIVVFQLKGVFTITEKTNPCLNSPQVLEEAIRPDTVLVSIMTVNNEIGVKQPIREIGRLCRANKVFFHTDAAQAVGKVPIDVNDQSIDLMSISGHKIYGPKGVYSIGKGKIKAISSATHQLHCCIPLYLKQ